MTPKHRRPYAAFAAITLVIAIVALGLLLEHTVGPSWAGGGSPQGSAISHPRFDPSARRIPPGLKPQLLNGQRLGGRYGGSDFSNLQGLRKAMFVELGIGAIVVVLTVAWRRLRARGRSIAG